VKIDAKKIRVIHWLYNAPTNISLGVIPTLDSHIDLLRAEDDKKIIGLRFRLVLRIASKKEQILSYITEQDFLFENFTQINKQDIINIDEFSLRDCSNEFDKLKQPTGITANLSSFLHIRINPEQALADLKRNEKS
jgi:hypothetical protein